jgi:hypothetical protein
MFIEEEPRKTIQAPLGAAWRERLQTSCWPRIEPKTCRSCRSLNGARTVCAIDMALLPELCPRANTSMKTLKNPAVRPPGWLFRVNRHAQRLECDQLAGALERCRAPESGSKLHALQTLCAVWLRLCRRESLASLRLNGPSSNCMITASPEHPPHVFLTLMMLCSALLAVGWSRKRIFPSMPWSAPFFCSAGRAPFPVASTPELWTMNLGRCGQRH